MSDRRSRLKRKDDFEPLESIQDLPDIYGLRCVGDCMAPELPDGCRVAASKSMPYQPDDIVVIWLRPDAIRPGGTPALVKRMVMMPPPNTRFPWRDHPKSEVLFTIAVAMNSQPGRMMMMRCSDIIAIHRAIAVCIDGDAGYRSILRPGEELWGVQ